MFLNNIHRFFSFTSLVKLLIALAVILQLIIISQMFFLGSDLFTNPLQVIVRLLRGVIFSFLAGWILAYPSLFLIRLLNSRMPWRKYTVSRVFLQFGFAIAAGVMIAPIILYLVSLFFEIEFNVDNLINNAYYLSVLSLFLMVILEARIHFRESMASKNDSIELEKKYLKEAADKAIFEARASVEEEKNKVIQQMIAEEKTLNNNLFLEIERGEIITRQLQESREQLHSLLSHLMGAVYRCRFDESYTMDFISDKILDITGYPPTDFIENRVRTYSSIVHPDDVSIVSAVISDATLSRVHYDIEYRLVHQDGNTIWVSENGKCIFDEYDQVAFLDGIIIDITRRKEAELAAKESDRRYKELMDFLPQPIFELDIKGNILFINRAGQKFFGIKLPDDTSIKVSALDYMVEEDAPRVIENIKKSNQEVVSFPNEYTVKRPDGTLCPVLIYGSPIIRDDQVIGRRGFIIDISERKQYEVGLLQAKNELEQVNNNLEQMVAERSRELVEANNQLLKVQKENLQSQFEILRQQINPHFLFNSLNVLSGLIGKDKKLAQLFIDEFSQIYRYVLETLEQPVASLVKELDFMRSYLYLQQIRYGKDLTYSVNVQADLLEWVIPPLSLQVVLENALKHNIVNEAKPLHIEIFTHDNKLVIKNRLQPKISKGISTGLGLKNLIKRYALICNQAPAFAIENNHYVATLPLINTENDERSDS